MRLSPTFTLRSGLVCAALLTLGCQTEIPADATPPGTDLPAVGTLTFDELDLAGCGLTLLAPGTDSRIEGFYLFSGLPNDTDPSGSMRMKLNNDVVNFVRTATSGEALMGGQFTSQTFVSQDGQTTVVVDITRLAPEADQEVVPIEEATIRIEQGGESLTLTATGDTGC
ncbi:MAG: hypothetical protein VKI82_15880 [Leptolyngbya sp.]|nr:hypothetical protein [Leptolyngbya sp.]